MFILFGILDDLRSSEIDAIVQVAQEKQVHKLVCQVKLAQLLVFQRSHPLQNVVVVLITPTNRQTHTYNEEDIQHIETYTTSTSTCTQVST